MKEKILALLIAQFSGVRKDGLAQLARTFALQVTTEDEAKALCEKLTKAQVDDFVKDYRAEVDKEVSDGNKTYESNLKKKFDLVEKKNPEPGADDKTPKGGDPNDIASLVKAAVAEAVSPLQAKLEGYEKGDIAKTRLQSLTEKLSTCKDDNFKAKALKDFARMNFETEDEFNEYLSDTETDIAMANQTVANSSLGGEQRPWMSNNQTDKKEASKEEIDAVFDKLPI